MLRVFSKKTNFVLMGIIVGFSIGMSIHQAFGDTTSVPGTLQGDSLTVNTSGQYTNGLIVANGNAVVAGNVGIGTTLPSVKLDVLGDIKSSTKICVGATCIDETQLKAKLRVKTLSITKSGTGDGTIISSPDGINCGAVCASNFSNNISIILTASPAIGSVFASWGGACSGTGNCTITLSDDKTVTATFTSTATTVNGVCSTTAETCTSGTYSNSPDDTATNYQWTCLGAGSPVGTDSGTCTAVISSAGACGDKVAFTYNNSSVTYGIVTDADGKCWMDRNLGATQVATSSTDTASYGHLFQWGRDDDGHQVTTSGTTSTNADIPGNNLFITEGSSPYDWRVNQDGTLWANSSSTNNPCPANWHVPTQTEWATWVTSAGVTNSATAYNSTLKLPLAGYRGGSYLNKQGSGDFYWSSSPNGTSAYHLYFDSGAVSSASSANRAFGLSVRCVKDTSTVPTTQSLTITKSGTGSGTVTSEPTGSTFTSGLSVTLTATPNAGSTFAGWSGDCSGTALACTVVMSSDKSVTATFATTVISTYTLSVLTAGTGTGTVTSVPAGIDCGATCAGNFTTGATVTLTATTPVTGSTFAGWTGACTNTTGVCTVTLSAARSVTATFSFSAGGCGDTITFTYNGSPVTYGTVTGADGKCWMDRNLGAKQVAISSTDYLAYGDLFQWGRRPDGHQLITWTNSTTGTAVNGSTATLADIPADALFITNDSSPYDWCVTPSDTLWANSSSTNNPCPANWHVPTQAQWATVAGFFSPQTSVGAFNSALKLPLAGYRNNFGDASLDHQRSFGFYWSSSPNGTSADSLYFYPDQVYPVADFNRALGFSVRCVKD